MTTQAPYAAPHRRLAAILKADAAFCAAIALPGLVAPGWLAGFLLPETPALLGFPMATVMLEAGIGLALSAIVLLVIATRPSVSRLLAGLSAGIDAALAAGTVLLLAVAGSAFSRWGALALLIVAADTALIAWLKLRALRSASPVAAAA